MTETGMAIDWEFDRRIWQAWLHLKLCPFPTPPQEEEKGRLYQELPLFRQSQEAVLFPEDRWLGRSVSVGKSIPTCRVNARAGWPRVWHPYLFYDP